MTRSASMSRGYAWLLVAGGLIGLAASGVLLHERILLLEDPLYAPSCSLNSTLNCTTVMTSSRSEAFGLPNPVIGVAAFPVLVATGAAVLAGARLARWYWWGLMAGTTLGVVFVHWLIVASLYDIGSLCPYCMVVWAVTIPAFWYTLLHLISGTSPGRLLNRWHATILAAWVAVIAVLILLRFG